MGKIKSFFLNLFFPKFCLNCQREGAWLCSDCQALLEINQFSYCLCQKPKQIPKAGKCSSCRSKSLDGLYCPLPYQNILVKSLIENFKYQPFIKELSEVLASLIINHFQLLEKKPDFFSPLKAQGALNGADFIIIPIPLHQKKLKWRGFNQAEEIARHLSNFLNLEILTDVLIKIKETPSQVILSEKERRENLKGVFFLKNREKIKGRKILLVDDVYTTGSTLEEAAKILKEAGAKEIIGIVVARASPGQDKVSFS